MENDIYSVAFAEIYEIFTLMDEDDLKKIPEQFKEFIKENKSKVYVPKIDRNIPLYKQELKKETFAICSLIYRDYLVSPEKRKEIEEKEKIELEKIEKELREKYNPDMFFENKIIKNKENNGEIISSNENNFLKKVFEKILKIIKNFRRKNE